MFLFDPEQTQTLVKISHTNHQRRMLEDPDDNHKYLVEFDTTSYMNGFSYFLK